MAVAPRVLVDSLLKELGVGKFQYIAFGVIAITMFVNSMASFLFIFSTRDPEYRCRIPECESPETEYNVSWVANAIPVSATEPEKCYRFAPAKVTEGLNDSCPGELFDRTRQEQCEEYVFGEGDTIVKEFNIPCQEWKRVLVGTMNGVGQFICFTFFGFLSDKYGRKNTMVYATLLCGVIGTAQSFTVEYWSFLFLEFLNTSLTTGTYSAAFLLGVEQLAPEKRTVGTMFMNATVSLSTMFLGVAAWIFPYWRTLFRIANVPSIFIIVFTSTIPESIRWLVIKGRHQEAARAICKAAKLNNCKLSDESQTYVELLNLDSAMLREGTAPKGVDETVPFLSIMKSRKILLRLIVCAFCWITNVFVYYGLNINIVSLSSNRSITYLNFILVSAIDLPSQIFYLYLLDWVGRRKSLSGSLIICAIFSFLFAFIPDDHEIVLLIIYLLAKLFVTLSFSVLYIHTAEMFPTTVRHTCMGCCSMLGRIGNILAPQTALLAQYHASVPMVMYGVIALLSGLTVLIFPETTNIRLPDTILEAENMECLTTAPSDTRHTNEGTSNCFQCNFFYTPSNGNRVSLDNARVQKEVETS